MNLKKAAVAFVMLLAAFSISAQASSPNLQLIGSPAQPGEVILLQMEAQPRPLILRWEFLGQSGGFYRGREGGNLYFAIIAIPLATHAGVEQLTVSWGAPGQLVEHPLPVSVLADKYPSSKQSLKVSGLKKKLKTALGREKSYLLTAWGKAGGKPRWRGYFIKPLSYEAPISSVFGKKRVYNNGEAGWRHKGVDFAAPTGTSVQAPNHGQVLLAMKDLEAYGGVVVIGHGYNLASTFMHLNKVNVRTGERIRKGTKIGEVGSKGIATGPHLHWQMTLQSIPIQPLQWLESQEASVPH